MNIVDALHDRKLLGGLPCFRDLTPWSRWLVFLKALDGLPLNPTELAIFQHHTGRAIYSPPPGGYREAVAIVGRQSGKSRIAAAISTVEAVRAQREADGTEIYSVSVAQDERASLRTIFKYATAPFGIVEALRQSLLARRAKEWVLRNGVVLAAYPCRPESLRGIRAVCVVLDELAFYRSSENTPVDVEMLRAVRPTLATTSGRLVILSSPYGQAGSLWEIHRQHFGRDDSTVLVWQGSAPEMNPTLSADYLARMQQDDPEGFRSEVLGEFRAGIATFLDPDALESCVDQAAYERPYVHGVTYVAGFDASGGRADRASLAIAHNEDGQAVLDLVRAWNPPFNPAAVIHGAADVLKHYGITSVIGDRYGAGFTVEAFRTADHSVTYEASERDRSALYLELLPLVNSGRVRLLADANLLREFRGLERRRGAVKDRVDHRPGAHDDRAIAATLALVQAATGPTYGRIERWIHEANLSAPPATATLSDQFFGTGRNRTVEQNAFGHSSGGVANLARRAFGR